MHTNFRRCLLFVPVSLALTLCLGFREGASGPFGADIPSLWMSSRQCLINLAIAGLGWTDIHACRQQPDSGARV